MDQPTPRNAGVIAPPPLIFAGGLAAGLALQRLLRAPTMRHPAVRVTGMALCVCSVLLGSAAAWRMRRADTALNPASPTTTIVTDGPYRYTRNPIYVSFVLLYVGIAAIRGSWLPLVVLPGVLAVMVRGVIEREERYLEQLFGTAYTRYRATVPRWL